MAYIYKEIHQGLTTITQEYNSDDGSLTYLTILKKWIGRLFVIIQEEIEQLHVDYPTYPYYQIVKADTTIEDFETNPFGCKLDPYNNPNAKVSGAFLNYDFKVATFAYVKPNVKLPLLSERFRIKIDTITSSDGTAGVLLKDDDGAEFERGKTITSVGFLNRLSVGKTSRTFAKKPICTGGKGIQKATGLFSYCVTNSAFLIGGALGGMPYTLFNFFIGTKMFADERTAISNGIAKIDNSLVTDFIFLPSKVSSRRLADRLLANSLILRHNKTDYYIPNVFITDEGFQNSYVQIQGKFLNLNNDRIVTPDPEIGAAMDESGALALLAVLESFPTTNKSVLLR